VVTAAGAGVAAVDHELLGRQPALVRFGVQHGGDVDEVAPAARGVDVHLDHTGIGRDLQPLEPRVVGRVITLQLNG
jgi:hypothetical protein